MFRFAQMPSSPNKMKNKAKASQIVPVVILIVAIVGHYILRVSLMTLLTILF